MPLPARALPAAAVRAVNGRALVSASAAAIFRPSSGEPLVRLTTVRPFNWLLIESSVSKHAAVSETIKMTVESGEECWTAALLSSNSSHAAFSPICAASSLTAVAFAVVRFQIEI